MNTHISGVVRDDEGNSIPGAMVYISDDKGALKTAEARVLTDVNGNYKLPFAIPFMNPITGTFSLLPIGRHITARYTGYPAMTQAITSNVNEPQNVVLISRVQDVEEVTVTSSGISNMQKECEAKGGVYTQGKRTPSGAILYPASCKMPTIPVKPTKPSTEPKPIVEKETFWKKNKILILAGGGSLLLLGIIAIIVVSSSEKEK